MIKIKSCILLSLTSMIGLWINESTSSPLVAATSTTSAVVNSSQYCAWTYNELQNRILKANATKTTRIDVCNKTIMLEGYLHITNKKIELRCHPNITKKWY